METFETIYRRRSLSRLVDPGPDASQLERILGAAACAPDHEELRPWRFVVIQGPEREHFGEVLVEALVLRSKADGRTPTEGQISQERKKMLRAPVVIAGAAEIQSHHAIPDSEQVAATAAAMQNALLAATDLGFGSIWRTGPAAYDPWVRAALGLSEAAVLLGWLYIGTVAPTLSVQPHEVPELRGIVSYWTH